MVTNDVGVEKLTEVKPVQAQNAVSPMLVTDDGSKTELSLILLIPESKLRKAEYGTVFSGKL